MEVETLIESKEIIHGFTINDDIPARFYKCRIVFVAGFDVDELKNPLSIQNPKSANRINRGVITERGFEDSFAIQLNIYFSASRKTTIGIAQRFALQSIIFPGDWVLTLGCPLGHHILQAHT